MSLPEISRRCLSCGAAARAGARFCPQCGKALAAGGASAEPAGGGAREERRAAEAPARADAPSTREVEAPSTRETESPAARDAAGPGARETEAPRATTPTTRDVHVTSREAPAARTVAEGRAGAEAVAPDKDAGRGLTGAGGGSPGAGGGSPGAGDGLAGAGGGEAGAAAGAAGVADAERRGRVARVREVTRERVGRMRDEALVALEETPDDAGLRFVVVAVALFLLSALLLFLSVAVLR
jgi:hypothetical protein